MSDIFSELLGPVTGLAGSILGDVTKGDATAATNAANAANSAAQTAYEKEFAQNGIQWRVADAKAAGLSPQAAIGASEPSYSPTTIASDNSGGDSDTASFLQSTGQDLSRAALAGQSGDKQADTWQDAHNRAMAQKDETTADLKIKMLRSQLANMTQQPGIPDAFIKVRMPDGTVTLVPSKDAVGAGFFPGLREGLGYYGSAMGAGSYLQSIGNAAKSGIEGYGKGNVPYQPNPGSYVPGN